MWYRVASLKPRIRSHVHISRHVYRGNDWYVLSDRVTGKYHRISTQAYHIVGLMNGKRSLKEIWDAACSHLKESMPTQDEVIHLLSNLHHSDILMADIQPDTADLHDRMVKEKKANRINMIRSPMSIKIPLLDPDKYLTFFKPVTDLFICRSSFAIWLMVVITAVVMAIVHLNELTQNVTDRILGMENIILLWFVYPFVKLLHELGHACCVKKWDGEVHDVGIMFLVFIPIPYIDASASICFSQKKRRMIVDAAGIIIELFLAACALFLWLNIEPGLVSAICFNIMIIAGISTLLFNGNPLLKFDAYYILCDAIEIPNLASKSNQFVGYLLKKNLLQVKDIRSPADSIKEALWLGFYSVLSFAYRIYIAIRISFFVAGKFFIIGVLLAIWAGVNMMVMPVIRMVKKMMNDTDLSGKRAMAFLLAAGAVFFLFFTVMLVPLPYSTLCEGVIQNQAEGIVYAGADGVMKSLLVAPGTRVTTGDDLFQLENPDYKTAVEIKNAQLAEYAAKLEQIGIEKKIEYDIVKEELAMIRGELQRIQEKQRGLTGKSPSNGIFYMPDTDPFMGRYYHQGQAVGYIVNFEKTTIQVVIHQAYADMVRQRTTDICVRFSSDITIIAKGKIQREIPAASDMLPNLALSLEGGGDIALDPKEGNRPKTFEKYFQFEIEIDKNHIQRIGERVFVKFIYDPEPVFYRLKRFLQRLFMTRFEI